MPTEPTPADEAAIVGAVLDYFEGWFEGDAARMERALHPITVSLEPAFDVVEGGRANRGGVGRGLGTRRRRHQQQRAACGEDRQFH